MNIRLLSYYLILLLVCVVCVVRWKQLAKGERFIALLMFLTLATELTAFLIAQRWHNNMPVYHIYNPIEFLLTSFYFNCSIDYFRKRNTGVIVGIVGVLLSVLNTLFLQKITTINSNFLLLEGTAIIIYSLLMLHQVLLDEEHLPYSRVHFWIALCCLIFWATTFTGWGFYAVFNADEMKVIMFFDKVLTVANFLFYIGIGTTLAMYKRLTPTTCA
jgi:hypothetical protein